VLGLEIKHLGVSGRSRLCIRLGLMGIIKLGEEGRRLGATKVER
jgi:hypothetical protein